MSKTILVVFMFLSLFALAQAQDAASRTKEPSDQGGIDGDVFRVGSGVSAPRPVFTPDPEYSGEALNAKYQGTCMLWLVVGPDGKTRDIRVVRTLGLGLDEKAIEAVKQWKFEPAMKDGKPVAVQVNVEVTFHLPGLSQETNPAAGQTAVPGSAGQTAVPGSAGQTAVPGSAGSGKSICNHGIEGGCVLPREEFSEDLLNSSLALADALKLYPELLKNAPPRLTGIDGEASSLLARIQDLSSKLGKDFTPRDSDDLRTMLTLFHDCRKFALRAEAARDRHPNPYEWAPITRVDQEITQKVGARTHLNLDDLESVVQQEEDRARQAAMTPEQHMKFECDHMFDGKKLGNGSYGEAKAAQRACLAHATFDTCCQTPAQQMWYCKAWANDPEHMRDLPPKPISWGRRCPELLACHPCTNNLENFVRGVEVTEQERATARKVIQNEQQKETEEQATREAEHRRQAEIARADYERRKKAYDEQQAKFRAISAGIWKQLNLHKGETQATVKERLREFGFHSTVPNYPGIWVCTEARLKGYNWTNGCAAQDKDGHGITVLFLVAQRYRDPDTGIVSDRRVDRLIAADFDEGVGKIDPELSDLQ